MITWLSTPYYLRNQRSNAFSIYMTHFRAWTVASRVKLTHTAIFLYIVSSVVVTILFERLQR